MLWATQITLRCGGVFRPPICKHYSTVCTTVVALKYGTAGPCRYCMISNRNKRQYPKGKFTRCAFRAGYFMSEYTIPRYGMKGMRLGGSSECQKYVHCTPYTGAVPLLMNCLSVRIHTAWYLGQVTDVMCNFDLQAWHDGCQSHEDAVTCSYSSTFVQYSMCRTPALNGDGALRITTVK